VFPFGSIPYSFILKSPPYLSPVDFLPILTYWEKRKGKGGGIIPIPFPTENFDLFPFFFSFN